MKKYVFLFVFLPLLSCGKVADQPVQKNVDELVQAYVHSWDQRDVELIGMNFSHDAVVINGNIVWNGIAEIASQWIRKGIPVIDNVKVEKKIVKIDEHQIFLQGIYQLDIKEGNGVEFHETGNIGFVWENIDGKDWKISFLQIDEFQRELKE